MSTYYLATGKLQYEGKGCWNVNSTFLIAYIYTYFFYPQVPKGGICGVVANREDMFVVQWGANTEANENACQTMIKPKMPAVGSSLWKVDPDTAQKLAEIKQMEAALRRKEIAEKEGKRLAERHNKVKTAKVTKRTNRVVNLINDLELL